MAITAVLLIYAIATGGSQTAIGLNLIWGYFLFVFAIAAAIFCAVCGMVKNPAGIKGTIVSLALILIVIGASYFYSASHTVNIIDLQNNGFFGHGEAVITETSILVTYVAFVAAFLTAIVTEIRGAFK
ncbi:MAG: hypothetical protein K2H77_06495 [Alistipes sp.]|nr:hypothetical protein [Alistipes sp.]